MTPEMFILEAIDPQSIVVINLDRRPDRWERMLASWHPEVATRFFLFPATDGRLVATTDFENYRNGRDLRPEQAAAEFACRDSWIRAVEQFGPSLYFEDDARPGDPWPYGLPSDSAGLVCLGGNLWRKSLEPGWRSAHLGTSGSHAIWIRTDRAAQALLDAWRSDAGQIEPVDVSWVPALERIESTIAVPQMAHQIDLVTDVQMGRVFHPGEITPFDPWCSLEGGIRRVRRSESWKRYGYFEPEISSRALSR